MGNDTMDLTQLAAYLSRDRRELTKLADRGGIPGRKVGGEWRFAKAEIHHWISTRLHQYDEAELTALESSATGEIVIASLLSEACMAVPFRAGTKGSVLRELVNLAEQSWQVYDPAAILAAIQEREEQQSTAMPGGVAIPHLHRPMPNALGETVLAYGRTSSGIPFGAADLGGLTDIFFLVLSHDDQTHLRVLARLSRLLLRPGFIDSLRAADSPAETWQIIDAAEKELAA